MSSSVFSARFAQRLKDLEERPTNYVEIIICSPSVKQSGEWVVNLDYFNEQKPEFREQLELTEKALGVARSTKTDLNEVVKNQRDSPKDVPIGIFSQDVLTLKEVADKFLARGTLFIFLFPLEVDNRKKVSALYQNNTVTIPVLERFNGIRLEHIKCFFDARYPNIADMKCMENTSKEIDQIRSKMRSGKTIEAAEMRSLKECEDLKEGTSIKLKERLEANSNAGPLFTLRSTPSGEKPSVVTLNSWIFQYPS